MLGLKKAKEKEMDVVQITKECRTAKYFSTIRLVPQKCVTLKFVDVDQERLRD